MIAEIALFCLKIGMSGMATGLWLAVLYVIWTMM